ncbi:MAG: hypothetical protein IT340_21455 [Chloroflexi bacterium]|nr:hypothetical protein [Chloroflexota bacterium]
MAANTTPIFTVTPNVGSVKLGTTSAQVKSDGTSAGTGTDLMYKAFTAGANGSYVESIRFQPVASAANVTSVATVLRAYLSTVANPGATTSSDTTLLGEVSVPAIAASHSTNATNYYEIVLNKPIPAGTYIHVAQHVAQTTNQQWQATVFGGNY